MAAAFILAPDEEFVQCPYEPSHQITNLKFLLHLNKCRENYKKACKAKGKSPEIVTCRFNYLHQVPKPELDYHHRECGERYKVVKHIQYHASDEFNKVKEEANKAAEQQSGSSSSWNDGGQDYEEEDWDKDSNGYTAGYDPSEKLKNEAILYIPRGMTKSERKAFRLENRKKFAELEEAKQKQSKVEEGSYSRQKYEDDDFAQ